MKTLTSHGRVRITPATIIAVLALVLAAGGGAYAATTLGGSVEWAVVTPSGQLARGKGALTAEHTHRRGRAIPGEYKVLFNEDVSHCSYKATLGSSGTKTPQVGDVGVARQARIANVVFVRTTNLKGAGADKGFHLAVVC